MSNEAGYALDKLAELCTNLGFSFQRPDQHTIDIMLTSDAVFTFANLPEENDTMAGFRDVPSHFHGSRILMTGGGTYVEYNELELLRRIAAGDVVIITLFRAGKIEDRWLAHKLEPLDLKYIDKDEEMRITRVK